jgi:hypothetical protein
MLRGPAAADPQRLLAAQRDGEAGGRPVSHAEARPAADAVEMFTCSATPTAPTVITRKFGRSPEGAVTVGSL